MKHHTQASTCWLKTSKSWTDIVTFSKRFQKVVHIRNQDILFYNPFIV